jgi:hypothetical protein
MPLRVKGPIQPGQGQLENSPPREKCGPSFFWMGDVME